MLNTVAWGEWQREADATCPWNVSHCTKCNIQRGQRRFISIYLFIFMKKVLPIPRATAKIAPCQSEEDCDGRSCRIEKETFRRKKTIRSVTGCAWEINRLCFCSVSHFNTWIRTKRPRLAEFSNGPYEHHLTKAFQPNWQSEAGALLAYYSMLLYFFLSAVSIYI